MKLSRSTHVAGMALLMLMGVSLAIAQSNSRPATQAQASADHKVGGITVLVLDPSGAVVPNANVQVTRDTGDVRVLGTTNQTGLLGISGLPAGSYKLEVWAQGFMTAVERVNAEADRTVATRIQLVVPHGWSSPPGGQMTSVELYAATETKLDPVPYIPFPRQPNFFQRTFGALFHKLGF